MNLFSNSQTTDWREFLPIFLPYEIRVKDEEIAVQKDLR